MKNMEIRSSSKTCRNAIIGFYLALMTVTLPLVAAAQGKNGFESYRDGNTEIYVVNSDGSNQTRLTFS